MNIMCIEKVKFEVAKEKNAKDNETIEQANKLKHMDFELKPGDQELKTSEEFFENLAARQEKPLKCRAAFEADNGSTRRLFANTEELSEAIGTIAPTI